MRSKLLSTLLMAGIALSLSGQQAKADTLTVNLSDKTNSDTENYPTVQVTLSDTANPGKITVEVNVVPGTTGYIGDLRGVFFNLPNASGLQIQGVSGGPITAQSTDGNFGSFGNSALLEGVKETFGVGVEIGGQGIAQGDDYQKTVFTVAGSNLKLSDFTSQSFGVRMMSVGDPNGDRELSSKTAGTSPETVTATNPTNPGGGTGEQANNPGGGEPSASPSPSPSQSPESEPVAVPEPTTIFGSALALAGLAKWRSQRNKKN